MSYPEGVQTRTVKTVPLLDYSTGKPIRGVATAISARSPLWAATGELLLQAPSDAVIDALGVATWTLPAADQDGFTDGVSPIRDWTTTFEVANADPNGAGVPEMTLVVTAGSGTLTIAPNMRGVASAGVVVEYFDVPTLPGGIALDEDGVPYYDPVGEPVLIDEDGAPYYVA